MPKEENQKEVTLVGLIASACACVFAFMAMSFLGLSDPSEEIGFSIVQALLFGCIFTVFNLITFRFFKWLYIDRCGPR